MKILFIDDSAEYLESVKSLCKIAGVEDEVLCFVDAFEAMNFISRNPQQILGVFTDYRMSSYGMSGEIIASKCQEVKVPVYICTGYTGLNTSRNYNVICKHELEKLLLALRDITGVTEVGVL